MSLSLLKNCCRFWKSQTGRNLFFLFIIIITNSSFRSQNKGIGFRNYKQEMITTTKYQRIVCSMILNGGYKMYVDFFYRMVVDGIRGDVKQLETDIQKLGKELSSCSEDLKKQFGPFIQVSFCHGIQQVIMGIQNVQHI